MRYPTPQDELLAMAELAINSKNRKIAKLKQELAERDARIRELEQRVSSDREGQR